MSRVETHTHVSVMPSLLHLCLVDKFSHSQNAYILTYMNNVSSVYRLKFTELPHFMGVIINIPFIVLMC